MRSAFHIHTVLMMDRPLLTRDKAIDLASEIFALYVDSSSAKCARELDSYDDRNFYLRGVKDGAEGEFLLKVYNPVYEDRDVIDALHQVMFCLKNGGVVCPVPQKTVAGDFLEIRNLPLTPRKQEAKKPKLDKKDSVSPSAVCLFTFVQGKTMRDLIENGVSFNNDAFYRVGQFVAIVTDVLKDLKCSVLEDRKYDWDLYYFGTQKRGRSSLTSKQKELVDAVEKSFRKFVRPRFDVLPKQCIHGDINDGNVIVWNTSDTQEFEVSGVIDFGDANYSCRIFEIAIATTYMMILGLAENKEAAISAGANAVAGFHDKCPLSQDECDVLFYCMKARLCQIACFGTQSSEVYPDNAEYLLYSVKKAWTLLDVLAEVSNDHFHKMWRSHCKN